MMEQDIESILFSQQQIEQRVRELGAQISRDYKGKSLILLCILRGAVMFFSDLMKYITIPCEIDFLSIASYGMSTESSGMVHLRQDMRLNPKGKNVLIVEDILDTGFTLSYITEMLKKKGTASVKIAAFLNKPSRRKVNIALHYCGYDVENKFVVGYGLDYQEKYRNLPYIGELKKEVYEN